MKRTTLRLAVFAGMLGIAACGGDEELSADGESGLKATGSTPDTVTTPLPEAGAEGAPGAAPTTTTGMDTTGMDTMQDTTPR